jgi:hypothetical protein
MKIEQFVSQKNILVVSSFNELVATPFRDEVNAICWKRNTIGNFEEIVSEISFQENIVELDKSLLLQLDLSQEGQLAREVIINDLQLLKTHGAQPSLNMIKYYERDDENAIVSTDVYSFHVDSSPIATDTFLCTYFGAPSEIVANEEAEQKILIPALYEKLKEQYGKTDDGFAAYLSDNCFDLHYQAKANANIISLGMGNLWRLATKHPHSKVLPCIHRAPKEKEGQSRMLLIC